MPFLQGLATNWADCRRAAAGMAFVCFSCGVVIAQEAAKPSAPPPSALAATTAPAPAANTPAPTQASNTQPRCDAACVRASMSGAAQACAPRIEAEAPIDYEWLTRPVGSIFQEADPSSAENSVVVYRGDTIRFLNPQKEWVRVAYQCAFDVAERKVMDVRLRPGRLSSPPTGQANGKPLSPTAAKPSGAAAAQPQPKIESAALAAAIQQAAQKRQAQNGAGGAPAPKPPKPPRIGEESEIEFTQMAPNRRHD